MQEEMIQRLQAALRQSHVYVSVTLHTGTWRRQLKGAEVTRADNVVPPELTTKPQGKMIPKDVEAKLNYFNTQKRQILTKYMGVGGHTLPSITSVPRHLVPDMTVELVALEAEVDVYRRYLQDNFERIVVDWNREAWGRHWYDQRDPDTGKVLKGIQSLLIKPEDLDDELRLEHQFFELNPIHSAADLQTLLSGGRTHTSPAAQAAALEQTREMAARAVTSAVSAVLEQPLQQLLQGARSVQGLIAREGRVTSDSFNQLRQAAQVLREFASIPGLNDAELLATLDQALGQIAAQDGRQTDSGRTVYNLDVVGAQLSSALEAVVQAAERTTPYERLERFADAAPRARSVRPLEHAHA